MREAGVGLQPEGCYRCGGSVGIGHDPPEWAKALPNFPFTPFQSPRLREMSGHLTRGAWSSLADPGVNTGRSGRFAPAQGGTKITNPNTKPKIPGGRGGDDEGGEGHEGGERHGLFGGDDD